MTHTWAKMPYSSYCFSGADAVSFLQGQLTQDVFAITDTNCLYAAYCNHQGAMFANFLLSKNSSGTIVLRLHSAQADAVMRRLKMFVLRSAVDIELLDINNIGMNKNCAAELCRAANMEVPEPFNVARSDDFTLCALPNGYYEVSTNSDSPIASLTAQSKPSFEDVETLRVRSGNFHIYPETSELLLPQETPLETWGGISYTKGCYVGQEIIARSKYRGKIRKGLAVADMQTEQSIPLSSEIVADGRNVGVVIDSSHNNGQSVCMASLTLAAAESECSVANNTATFTFID